MLDVAANCKSVKGTLPEVCASTASSGKIISLAMSLMLSSFAAIIKIDESLVEKSRDALTSV